MNDITTRRIGKLLLGPDQRDAIHVAVAPVMAAVLLHPGEHVGIVGGEATPATADQIGIVDPFLRQPVARGEWFYLFLYPGTITSLRHEWVHPAFGIQAETPKVDDKKVASVAWLTAWAKKHMGTDYYGPKDANGNPRKFTDSEALANAVKAGNDMHIGPFESARDHIDNEWWDHWCNITGETAGNKRGEYFSCSC